MQGGSAVLAFTGGFLLLAASLAQENVVVANVTSPLADTNGTLACNVTMLANGTNVTLCNVTNATMVEDRRPLTDEEKEEAQARENQRLANERMEKRAAAKKAEAEARKKAEEAARRALEVRARAKEKAMEAKAKRDEQRRKDTEEIHRRKARAREPYSNPRDARTEAGLRHAFQPHWHEEESLLPLLHGAHAKITAKRKDNYTRVGDLAALVIAALNPDNHGPVHPDEHRIIEAEVKLMRQQEGLVDDNAVLHHGYLSRGSPLQFFQRVSRKLSAHRTRRTNGEQDAAREL